MITSKISRKHCNGNADQVGKLAILPQAQSLQGSKLGKHQSGKIPEPFGFACSNVFPATNPPDLWAPIGFRSHIPVTAARLAGARRSSSCLNRLHQLPPSRQRRAHGRARRRRHRHRTHATRRAWSPSRDSTRGAVSAAPPGAGGDRRVLLIWWAGSRGMRDLAPAAAAAGVRW